jgi:ABC-2 type transport system ATP-binding protein
VIELDRVTKIYSSFTGRRVTAVEEFSLTVAPGEVLGIAGPNGAGKSTLISILLGYLQPTSGVARVGGLSPREYVERFGVGYLSELIAITPRWPARQALVRYATLAGIPAAEVDTRVDTAIELLGIGEHRDKRVKALSKGNLQRLGLAQALLRDERLLILDEPTHGLDPVWTQRFRQLVYDLRAPDRTILIASHNLDELERLADRVVIIDRGRLQRIVDRGAGEQQEGAASYRLTFGRGSELVTSVFPAVRALGGGAFELSAELEALNAGLSELIARGALVASIVPAYSALERAFRESVQGGSQ